MEGSYWIHLKGHVTCVASRVYQLAYCTKKIQLINCTLYYLIQVMTDTRYQ